jgi:precorrin-8X/cobalt-precorrin-8 methylmutase
VNVRTETVTPPTRRYDYLTDGAEIYRRSFATIRAEAHLDHLPEDARVVAVRMVHASGDVDLTEHIAVHPGVVTAARTALRAGARMPT